MKETTKVRMLRNLNRAGDISFQEVEDLRFEIKQLGKKLKLSNYHYWILVGINIVSLSVILYLSFKYVLPGI